MREPLNLIRSSQSFMDLSPVYRQLHYFSLKPGYYITNHKHPFYHLNLYLEGAVTFHTESKDFTVTEGKLAICPPGLEHSLYTEHGYTQIGIDLIPGPDQYGLFQFFEATIASGFSVVSVPDFKRYTLNESFFHDFSDFNRFKAIHYIDAIILACISSLKTQKSNRFKDAFLEIMNQPHAYNLSVTEISRQLCLSKVQLERLTNKEFSCSVKAYCNKMKLSLLCQYLEHSDLTSKELCKIMDFYDESHLTTFFKRHMKITPKEYRRQNK